MIQGNPKLASEKVSFPSLRVIGDDNTTTNLLLNVRNCVFCGVEFLLQLNFRLLSKVESSTGGVMHMCGEV